MSPSTAFLILQGIETLPLRMQQHVENTKQIVEFLSEQEQVEWLNHPMLEQHPDHELAKRLMPNGCGAVFSFGIEGGSEAGIKFIENLEVFSHLANIGDAKSLVIHPASTTHHRMDSEALKAAGISEGLLRLSIGLEDVSDLITDLRKGLRASQRS